MIYISQVINHRLPEDRINYPYHIPALKQLDKLEFRKPVTFFIGENGAGKSTLIEAIAIKAGCNPEGGSANFNFSTHHSHSTLYEDIQLIRSTNRNKDTYFLRAESFYNVATAIIDYDATQFYNGSLHDRSHGESFLDLLHYRLNGNGLYIFDEPESALSIISQYNMLIKIKELVQKNSQFIIATHSPFLMAYPDADIIQITKNGLEYLSLEETEQFQMTKFFVENYGSLIRELGLTT